ncbi:hypothetical protein AB0L54_27335 [Streptomyces sp. NPDC052196]|uniref:hypothetical protein n=1 Tax=Streptomyces sp. NPDC052196 TaxID=3156691 RepID=UPI003444E29D
MVEDQHWFAGNAHEEEKARFDRVGELAGEIAIAHPTFQPDVPGERETTPEVSVQRGMPPTGADIVAAEAPAAGERTWPELGDICRELEAGLALA